MPGGVTVSVQSEIWQGQFPPPDAIERYEVVLPGSFDRLFRMTERRLEAEIEAAGDLRGAQRFNIRRGQLLGAGVTVLAMLGAVGCVALHQPWVAGAFLAVPVMSVAKALIDSTKTTGRNGPPPPAANTPSTVSTPDAPTPPP